MIKLKVLHLLIISITILFLTYAIHNYLTYDIAINETKKSAVLRNLAQSNNIMIDLDKYIDNRLNNFQELAQINQIKQAVIESNDEFQTLAEKIAARGDLENKIKNSETPFFSATSSSDLPDELKDLINIYKNEYDYDVVNELYVTNKYGFNIALGSGTSDYRQDDETWWPVVKSNNLYIGNLFYSEKYQEYALIMAFPIVDENGEFVGAMSVLVNLKDLLHDFMNDVDVLRESKKNVLLLDNTGMVIYEDGKFYPTNQIKEYFAQLTKETGSLEVGSNGQKLVAYAKSIGYKNFKGFDWTVAIEQDSAVLLDEFQESQQVILISVLIGMVSAIILSFILAYFVTSPLSNIAKSIKKISKGDFSTRVKQSKITEINFIIESFNAMESSLKKLLETEKDLAAANVRIKNERLTAIGELAASMAHDMKNPLGVIKSGVDIVKRNTKIQDDEINEVFQRMDRAIARMNHQVEDVLNYVRITPLQVNLVSINSIISSVLKSIDMPQNITIQMDQEDTLVNCDEKKMEIVFINIILNSIQAIGDDKGSIKIKIHSDSEKAIIEIQDSGPGIENDISSDIFKPLVTTKQKGTGLGLASCKNIIEQHGGAINFKNNPTTFIITLPKNNRKE